MRSRVTVRVLLTTISDLIVENRLERIDLLKVDVERAEMQVLEGIHKLHWTKISQVVAEVHGRDTLEAVTKLLRGNGFGRIRHETGDLLVGTNLYAVYARRD